LLVVGAGPAGLAGAIAAAEQGLRVLLVDELARPGGSLAWQLARHAEAREQLESLLAHAASLSTLEIRLHTQAAGCYPDRWIALVDAHCLTKLRAKAMLVATGCYEQPAVFQNNDLPGVMLGSAAQRLLHLYAVRPFDRCVVLAANGDGYRLALDLQDAGVDVAAVADLRHAGETTALGDCVASVGIPVYRGHTVHQAVPARGCTCIEGAVLCGLDARGQSRSESARHIACDGIAVSVGWSPAGELLYQAGGRFVYVPEIEQFVPRNLPAGLFAAGRVRGVFDWKDQMADGRSAGLAAAAYLGCYDGPVPEPPGHDMTAASHPYPIFEHRTKRNFVELDEDLHLADFVHAQQEGYDNIELMKRYTTVGMGPSQGKLANMNAVRILARLNGKTVGESGTTTARPFHQPVPLSHLAGRRLNAVRRTPMHEWHTAAGAQFVHVGMWLRPEVYRQNGASREDCILAEARGVRATLGLIDLGTLGKIQVCGAQAAEFLDRIYTTRLADQAMDTMRYALACDETGVIIDDGIVSRFAEDRYYVTATTSGAAALYREMQRHALVWRMRVTLANLTGQWTAMNLAGPRAREVLAPLTNVDLSNNAFPFRGAREGRVAGVRARLLRAGFVGEQSYELHVPASFGWHVWTTLIAAGEQAGIRPFGVEAQRLLRLEKGHLIVGQDTDALTNPYEADVAWAIGRQKPFFVGQRSLEIIRKKPLARRLVGFSIAPDYRGPYPEECHLIMNEDRIAGRVTSIAHRSTLGHALGLAFVQPDMAAPGTRLRIRIDRGQSVPAVVAKLPFFDAENARQNV
jgi:sarcosine oxidase subunit alpha